MPILRILLVLLIAVTTAGSARGADASAGDAEIEDQLDQGITLRRAGNDEAALNVFLSLEKRAPDSVRLLLHITTAAQATGKWIMAYDYLQKAASHRDDPYYQRHKSAIDNVERTIAQRVGQFRVRGSPPGAEVRLSGELVGTLPMTSIRAVEVGSYLLEVTKVGYFPLRRPVTVVGGGNLSQEDVELREQKPFLAPTAQGQTALQSDPAGADTAAPRTIPPQPWPRQRWVTWTLFGAGIAAGIASGVAFGVREADVDHWNSSSCLTSTPATDTRQEVCGATRHEIDIAQAVGVVAGITGVTLGAAALIHLLATPAPSAHPSDAATASQSGLRASCVPGLGTVVCAGQF